MPPNILKIAHELIPPTMITFTGLNNNFMHMNWLKLAILTVTATTKHPKSQAQNQRKDTY